MKKKEGDEDYDREGGPRGTKTLRVVLQKSAETRAAGARAATARVRTTGKWWNDNCSLENPASVSSIANPEVKEWGPGRPRALE